MRNGDRSTVSRSKVLLKEGRAYEAIDVLRPWLDANPSDPDGWAVLGAAFFELADYEESARAARRVVELRPDSARSWSNLGTVLRKTRHFDEAARAQRRALAIEPDYRRAHIELEKLQAPASPSEEKAPDFDEAQPAEKPTSAVKQRGGGSEGIRWPVLIGSAAAGIVLAFIVAAGIGHVVSSRRAEAQREQQAVEQERLRAAEQRRTASERERARQYEVDSQMRRNTVEYLDSFQSTDAGGAELTDAQRKARWEAEFVGQWVRWEGEVAEVKGGDETCSVSMRCGGESTDSNTRFELHPDVAVTLNKDQRVRIEGQLADHDNRGYSLENVRVVAKW